MGRTVLGVLAIAVAFGGVAASILLPPATQNHAAVPPPAPRAVRAEFLFAPPRPEDAPADIRELVVLGSRIMAETGKYAAAYTGNGLTCNSCHFNGGISRGGRTGGISLVGVAAIYPRYRERQRTAVDLITRTNDCYERSMNGRALPAESREMRALILYYQWISSGVPIYGKVPWLGVAPLRNSHTPDVQAGAAVYRQKCSACHGPDGGGTVIAPGPLWGPKSFNTGAGMSTMRQLPGFLLANMPKGNPALTEEAALDVAGYILSQPRPVFRRSAD